MEALIAGWDKGPVINIPDHIQSLRQPSACVNAFYHVLDAPSDSRHWASRRKRSGLKPQTGRFQAFRPPCTLSSGASA
ncbi:hypothetical protein WJX73_002589 [Symbiochloris irregularis]|uniref:Uncharacterized protein n=1 Tax=Symbiochloris irregularis TaxID=706552 RepID=A0AAW1NSQ7_9CHLO